MVERIYFDGDCGVCHWAVRFVARHDRRDEAFHFAPLNGMTFEQAFPQIVREELPDSLIVQTADDRMLLRSDGVAHILLRIGGPWRWLGYLLRLLPRLVRDTGYDLFARIRHRLVRKPDGVCPILPLELRGRFDP